MDGGGDRPPSFDRMGHVAQEFAELRVPEERARGEVKEAGNNHTAPAPHFRNVQNI